MFVFNLGRRINRYFKARKRAAAGRYLSTVRRIERVAPIVGGRYVAMTFDDGPCAAPLDPPSVKFSQDASLTQAILDTLKTYDAKGTFDIIGTTANNYPDRAGRVHTASWGGIHFDHYPDFGKDTLAGIEHQLVFAQRMVLEGHELANHGYRHILFGPMRVIYGRRKYYKSYEEVLQDLRTLHQLVQAKLGYTMRLSRPPHYIDTIPGGFSSYDVYHEMNYQYLAASFDGGGWKPTAGSYESDVAEMVTPLKTALNSNPNILNGQIIFQKDGYNMSRQSPVADALGEHLKLLSDAGYRVITVSELLSLSPFEDLDGSDPIFESVRSLNEAGYCIGYRNNTFQAERLVTRGELAMMLTPPDVLHKRVAIDHPEDIFRDVSINHPYSSAISWAANQEWCNGLFNRTHLFAPDDPLTFSEFAAFLDKASTKKNVQWNPAAQKETGTIPANPDHLRRRDVISVIAQLNL